LRYDSTAERLY
nr:Chain A, Complement component C8 alpha chain [synthetic construct]